VGPVWLYGVPMAFLTALKLGWPIYFAVLAVRLGEVIKGVILTVRFLSRKWVNIVIKDL